MKALNELYNIKYYNDVRCYVENISFHENNIVSTGKGEKHIKTNIIRNNFELSQ